MSSHFTHHEKHFTHTSVRPLTITNELQDVTCTTCYGYAEKLEGERQSVKAVDRFNQMAVEMEEA